MEATECEANMRIVNLTEDTKKNILEDLCMILPSGKYL